MKAKTPSCLFLCAALILAGCATPHPDVDLLRQQMEKATPGRDFVFPPGLKNKILALDPERVTEKDVREVLALAPAPRIINIHGGIYPVYLDMVSFSEFLTGMGYPEASIRNPGDGSYSFSGYTSSEKIAGAAAWYYERDGLRPMIVGHSLGGMMAVKVLHELSGDTTEKISVWNPLTRQTEPRSDITDPLTGEKRPVVGLQLSYVSALAAGGLARLLPNAWGVDAELRKIPDSVEEFTGFYVGLDIVGADGFGYSSENLYQATGKAGVRNVQLPPSYGHFTIPATSHLVKNQAIKDWINNYTPTNTPQLDQTFDSDSSNILWAADVWHGIKKHWVLELQRLIRAQAAKQKNDH
ncbi:MAG: alpha/beta hydrolase [Verrucomicrobiae bacterium]|nr:alpha/beta hydrolase [Verrucomicrobiae bacterium]